MKYLLIFLTVTVLCFGAWDNDRPADNRVWNLAAGDIRDNNDALEAEFGVDLAIAGQMNVINVKNPSFGAVGNGVADDRNAIQAAIDSVTSGGIIFFPVGIYLCNSTINVDAEGIRFVGETPTGSHLVDRELGSVIRLGAATTLFNVTKLMTSFENLYFDGNGNTGDLVSIVETSHTQFLNCTFLEGVSAIYMNRAIHGIIDKCVFRECGNSSTTAAIEVFNGDTPGTSSSDWVISNCTWEHQAGDCWEFDSGGSGNDNANFIFYAPKAEDPDFDFVFIKGVVDSVQIFGGFIRSDDVANVINITGNLVRMFGVFVQGTTSAISVTGNQNGFYGLQTLCTSGTANINVTGNRNVAIGCKILDTGAPVLFVGNSNTQIACITGIDAAQTAPTDQTYIVSDQVINLFAEAGEAWGWGCITAGTPGSWSSLGRVSGSTASPSNLNIEVQFTGRCFSNIGASGTTTLNLPAAVIGQRYEFIRTDSHDMRIEPDGSEVIRGGGAGKYLELDTDGDSVVLECFVDGKWEIMASNGTLAFEA